MGRRAVRAVFLACLSFAASALLLCPPSLSCLEIGVMTYNVHHCEGADGLVDVERIARIIAGSGVDLAALQEVDRCTERSGGVDQAARLGELTGMHAVFGAALDAWQGGEYGIAVLSRYPVEASRVHRLPSPPGGEERIVLEVSVRPEEETGVVLLNTHWSGGPRRRTHIRQSRALRGLAGERPGSVMILAGDLNVLPIGAAYRRLAWKWHDCFAAGGEPTYPAEEPRLRLDHVLFRSCGGIEPLSRGVLAESEASDHRPVVVRLAIEGPVETE